MSYNLHVNIVDTRTPASALEAAQREAAAGGRVENISVTADWSMDRICRRILERVNQHGSLGLGMLRLICHGNMGVVELGSGLTLITAGRFVLLRGRWSGNYPRIEVHSCGVLSGVPVTLEHQEGTMDLSAPGHAIMRELANAAQVLVIAAYNVQDADGRMAFEGPIRHFRPSRQ